MNDVTIKDIASRAGVSITTVSRVLNENYPVSSSARARVEKAIEDLNYLPNAIARSLRSSKTNLIALIVPDISNIFFTEMARGIEEEIQEIGCNLVVASTNNSPEREKQLLRLFIEKRLDAIVIAPTSTEDNAIKEILKYGLPTVIVDRYLKDVNATQILWPDYDMAYQMTKYLISNGHKKIAMVNVSLHNSNGQARRDGFLRALADFNIEINPKFVSQSNFNPEQSYEFIKRIMSEEDRPTAVFCANNIMVEGALAAFEELKLKVYDDVSIGAIGNLLCNKYIKPQISTLYQDSKLMGLEAGNAIKHQLLDKTFSPYCKQIQTPFMMNESIKNIK